MAAAATRPIAMWRTRQQGHGQTGGGQAREIVAWPWRCWTWSRTGGLLLRAMEQSSDHAPAGTLPETREERGDMTIMAVALGSGHMWPRFLGRASVHELLDVQVGNPLEKSLARRGARVGPDPGPRKTI